ncbi:TatD family hydrolase [Noviherbaspirillum aridicola]|uniref:Deoxyribonuclease n=1 Tax=Noviherbaspirillum aridicola TaxID=2849687 RepID=A0ABQ4Q9A4_9BURK|nr:TatD family hydrolase [Noviherbaspirillum aridicola]GIZ53556.1 deoxyribonuclease [Noviherbaspirillum aridicola]
MWIDTHCHLDASEFAGEHGDVAREAARRGVRKVVIPAVARFNFDSVRRLAAEHDNCVYALGIHPIFVPQAAEDDLDVLREAVRGALSDPNFVAVGEIGLDFFIPALCTPEMRARQERFYSEQLKIARDFGLPVLLHVRRSQDIILKYLRRIEPATGIAHAFNGSFQQAEEFIRRGFKLGFGGAMSFPRALQIRRLAGSVSEEALVLETDAPDIPPAWIHPGRNSPGELPRIGEVLAQLRGMSPGEIAELTSRNAHAVLTRLAG